MDVKKLRARPVPPRFGRKLTDAQKVRLGGDGLGLGFEECPARDNTVLKNKGRESSRASYAPCFGRRLNEVHKGVRLDAIQESRPLRPATRCSHHVTSFVCCQNSLRPRCCLSLCH